MSFIVVDGLPRVEGSIWQQLRMLFMACAGLRTRGKYEGTPEYDAALDAVKTHAQRNGLLLGHINAVEQEIARETSN